MQRVYLCHMATKHAGHPVTGVFDNEQIARQSWEHSYHKTTKEIRFIPTDDLGIYALKVFADDEHVGYIATHTVYTEVTHL